MQVTSLYMLVPYNDHDETAIASMNAFVTNMELWHQILALFPP